MKPISCVGLYLIFLFCLGPVTTAKAVDPSWAHTLKRMLPPFDLRPIPVGAGSQLSPDGQWIVGTFTHTHLVHLDAGGEEPQSLGLYDRAGRFVRDLTYPRFYRVDSFVWESAKRGRDDSLIFKSDSFSKEIGVGQCDLRTGRVSPYKGPSISPVGKPSASGASQVCKQWSPDGEDYLATVLKSPGVSFYPHADTEAKVILYSVQTRSGKRQKLAEGELGVAYYSPDGRRVLVNQGGVTPPQSMTPNSSSVIYVLWTIKKDGTGRTPLITKSQELRLASQHHWRYPVVSDVMGWCGERIVLASGSCETEQGEGIEGIWVSHRQCGLCPRYEDAVGFAERQVLSDPGGP